MQLYRSKSDRTTHFMSTISSLQVRDQCINPIPEALYCASSGIKNEIGNLR